MIELRKFLLAMIFVILGATFSVASDIYVAQNAAGGNSGGDCADAHAVSWFNSSANWGSGNGQIGPGTTVHLCGTFTGAANSTMLTIQGSGASGNPVTILFENGADLTAPYWSGNGAIICSGHNYITIDGGDERPYHRHGERNEPGEPAEQRGAVHSLAVPTSRCRTSPEPIFINGRTPTRVQAEAGRFGLSLAPGAITST